MDGGPELELLATLYVRGLLPPAEQAAMEAALPLHPELAHLVAQHQRQGAPHSDPDEGLERLRAQVCSDEMQRDHVAEEDPELRADVRKLLALYSALSRKMEALATPSPTEPGR